MFVTLVKYSHIRIRRANVPTSVVFTDYCTKPRDVSPNHINPSHHRIGDLTILILVTRNYACVERYDSGIPRIDRALGQG